jgi:hypothetical protein
MITIFHVALVGRNGRVKTSMHALSHPGLCRPTKVHYANLRLLPLAFVKKKKRKWKEK